MQHQSHFIYYTLSGRIYQYPKSQKNIFLQNAASAFFVFFFFVIFMHCKVLSNMVQ